MVMVAFVLSTLTGLVRQFLVASEFGTQVEMEAFNAANRVSETLFNLIAGGALGSAFIPVFTSLLALEEKKKAWKLASSMGNLVILTSGLASLVAAILAPQIVRYFLAPGFSSNPHKEALTIELLRLMLPSTIIFALSGLIMGILNAHQKFFIPALTPAMYQVGLIFGVLVLSPAMGIFGLGWGMLLGSALHLTLQLPYMVSLRGIYSFSLELEMEEVRDVTRLMAPRLLGVAVVQLNFWVNTYLASRMPEGSVTGVVIAFTLMLMPQAAIAQSIAIASLPTFSTQVALGRIDDMRHALASSLKGALLLSLPASLGLIMLREPIIRLFERGEFNSRSTELVAWALLWYAAGLVGHATVEILSRAFYSLHDTRTPVLVGIAAMSLNVVLSLIFSHVFTRLGWMPHGGLALANSTATALEAIVLITLMNRRLQGIEGKKILLTFLASAFGGGMMAIALAGWLTLSTTYPLLVVLLVGVAGGGLVYGLCLRLLRQEETLAMITWAKGRLKV